MIERVILNEAAYFYHRIRDLSNTFVQDIFRQISRNRTGHFVSRIVNENITVTDNISLSYSLCIFKIKEKPSFLDLQGNEEELKYAYLLIVQYSDMLIISKKNVISLDRILSNHVSDIDYITISRLFLSDRAYFEKFSMSNMDINDKAVRRRNVEALDLKSSFSPIYASRYILNNIRIRDQDKRISLALNTSRINRLGKKVSFTDYISWIVEVVDKIEAFELKETYLDNFSIPLNTQEILSGLIPNSILFHFNGLLDQFDQNSIENVEYRYGDNKKKSLNLQRILDDFNTFCEIQTIEIGNSGKYIHKIINQIDKNLTLKKNKSSLKISSSKLQNIFILYSGTEINLLDYINKSQSYIVTFSEMDIVYTNRRLFKDNKLLSNLESFMEVLEPYEQLRNITSEKGDLKSTRTSFDTNSLFHFIESKLSDADYLFCDDLGNEFADFISVKSMKSISYYHAKHATSQLSASDFQVVIGQALKNLGNMNMSAVDLERKKIRWQGTMNGTNIPLLRRGDNTINGGDILLKTLNSPNSLSHIYVVVNFLSRSELMARLINLRNGETVPHQVIQLFWMLSSFISTCKELGFQAHITCKP